MKRKKLFATVMLLLIIACTAAIAFASAAEGGGAEKAQLGEKLSMAIVLTAGISIAVAALGGSAAQSRAIAAALEGIARNPGAAGKIMTPMIIGLAMIESLVIYVLVISLILVGKL